MGEVYKATDTRLDRSVALKVLPAHIAESSELRQRFDREAKAISSLNHPHICVLHDVGTTDGISYIVMEYLEGETLAERIKRGPISKDELFRWAIQIGDALSAAHQRGLVHRDLKPGNVVITREGAKLLDFGLAKQQGTAGAPVEALTMTTPLTGTGTILGTLHYMSPEQLEGQEADARSDIFSFGAMLYEMATGKRAFDGKSQASLIAAILEREPRAASELVPSSPRAFDRVVSKCLAKDPHNRWQSARDMVDELRWIAEGGGDTAPASKSANPMLVWIGWGLAVLAIAATALLYLRGARTEVPSIRAIVTAPTGTQFLLEGDDAGPPVISPDGKKLAFIAVSSGGAQIWVRELGNLEARILPGTDDASFPFWSPDSKSLGFFSNSRLMRIDIATEQSFSVCATSGGPRGGTWGKDDIIVYSPNFQADLYQVPASGGTPSLIVHRDTTKISTNRWPQFLPDGKHVLYMAGDHNDPGGPNNGIWFTSLDGKDNHLVLAGFSDAAFARGQLFYVRDSVLFRQPFDPSSGRLSGEPRALQDRPQTDPTTWKANFSVSPAGVLVYQLAGTRQGTQMMFLDREGHSIRSVGPQGNHYTLCLAKDGKGLAYSSQEQPNGDLFYIDLQRDIRTRLTFGNWDKDYPVLSPQGDQLAYSLDSGRQGTTYYAIHEFSIDGAVGDRVVAQDTAADLWPFDWSPDGQYLLCARGDLRAGIGTLLLVPAKGTRGGRISLASLGDVVAARFSPDGHFVAYASLQANRSRVFVTRLPLNAFASSATGATEEVQGLPRWQVSTASGRVPRWRGDGRELFYLRPDGTAIAVEVSSEGENFKVGRETELFQAPFRAATECWDPSADGQHFIVNVLAGENSTPIVLVQNWGE